MRFSIEASELKNIINRVSAVTTKKSSVLIVSALEFSVKPNGILHVVATDLEQFASVARQRRIMRPARYMLMWKISQKQLQT